MYKLMYYLCAIYFVTSIFYAIISGLSVEGGRFKRDTGNESDDCVCVLYYQCINNTVIKDGATLINPRIGGPNVCPEGKFENEYVCCKLNKTNQLIPELKNPNVLYNETQSNKTNRLSCGAQKPVINQRIFNEDEDTTPIDGEFPWMASIFQEDEYVDDEYSFHCSGSLIERNVILTVNHYFLGIKPNKLKVILNGKVKLPAPGENIDHERNVKEIIRHPEYNSGTLANDLALLILDTPYNISRDYSVNTLCLPPGEVDEENIKCLVAGWGRGSTIGDKKILRKVELPVVSFAKCQDQIRTAKLDPNFLLHKSFVCAGGEQGKDSCTGDGGSPLICRKPNKSTFFQLGIVSWGIDCGRANVPGVYTNVRNFHKWIKTELKKRDISL